MSTMVLRPESRRCSGCGHFHPSPWYANCAVKLAKDSNIGEIIKFTEYLKEELVKYDNFKELSLAIKKLIQLKGILKKR